MLIKFIKKHLQFFKYCVGGGTAFIIDFSLLYFLTEALGLWYLWSATISFIVSAFFNFLIQKHWTFKSSSKKYGQEFSLFLSAQIVGLFINNITLYSLVEHAGMWYMAAKVVAAGIVLIWNFWINKFFIFNKKYKKPVTDIILAGEIFPPDIGGPATYTYRLAKELIKQKYNIHIICYSSLMPKQEESILVDKITRISSYLPLPLKYCLYFIKLLNISLPAKVIYAQGTVASGLPAALVSKIFRKKLIIKVVGDYGWEQAQIYGATAKQIDDWQHTPEYKSKSLSKNLRLKFLNNIKKFSVKSAKKIIVPSFYLKKLVTGWGVDHDKIEVIYNSVHFDNTPDYNRQTAQAKINLSGDLIISVARLVPWKGFPMLIKLMPELKKINPNFKLVIIGDGPEYNHLQQLIKQNHFNNDIYLVGRKTRAELTAYYLAASIFVLNTCYEGLSHVILDAMYYHLPIITTNVGGNPELIQDDYNGLTVAFNNKTAWLAAIKKIWQNKDLRERLCSNPLVKMDVFSFKDMVAKTKRILFN